VFTGSQQYHKERASLEARKNTPAQAVQNQNSGGLNEILLINEMHSEFQIKILKGNFHIYV
jgi:hypothetical protein